MVKVGDEPEAQLSTGKHREAHELSTAELLRYEVVGRKGAILRETEDLQSPLVRKT